MKRLFSGCAAAVLAAGVIGAPAPAQAADNTLPFGARAWLVEDLTPGPGHPNIQGNRVSLAGDRFVFSATTVPGLGHELFASDGTVAGTRVLKDLPGSGDPDYLVSMGAKAYFPLTDAAGDRELWVTDGTPAGTKRLKDLNLVGDSSPRLLTRIGSTNRFVFEATNSLNQHQLWVSDGTAAGTKVAGTGAPTFPGFFASIRTGGSTAYFTVPTAEFGTEPWAWGGTSNPPVVLDVNPGPDSSTFLSQGGAMFEGRMYGAADTGTGTELYRTNGTPGGTELVREINPTGSSSPTAFRAAHGLLYFSATNGIDGSELWATDGSVGGTVMLRDINPGAGGSSPQGLTVVGNRLVFTAVDGVRGRELWSSAGTPWSTRFVKDVAPGSASGLGAQIVGAGGRAWFPATDTGAVTEHGTELWTSDGTPAGTRLAADIRPGDTSTGLMALHLAVSGTIFMTGLTADHGGELWAYTFRTSATRALPKAAYSRSAGANKQVVVPVKVTATGATPIGKVTIRRNGVVWGSATLVGGVAKVRLTRALGKGSHTGFRAYYSGSVRARLSTSAAFTVKVL